MSQRHGNVERIIQAAFEDETFRLPRNDEEINALFREQSLSDDAISERLIIRIHAAAHKEVTKNDAIRNPPHWETNDRLGNTDILSTRTLSSPFYQNYLQQFTSHVNMKK